MINLSAIRLAICDDDNTYLKIIRTKIDNFFSLQNLDIEVKEYSSGKELLIACMHYEFSLIFLDIEMPELSGIKVVEKIRKNNINVEIIFLTSYTEYVFESIKYKPLRFIRKSYLDIELLEALEAFQNILDNSKNYYSFSTIDGEVICKIEDIEYMEVFKHYIYKEMIFKVRGTLKKFEKEFSKWGFIRIHKSFLVSYRYIYSINNSEVVLNDKSILPLSRNRNKYVKDKLVQYIRSLN